MLPDCPICDIVSTSASNENGARMRARRTAGGCVGVVRRKGFAATRAEEVAKRAGVSKGTLFLYFASKGKSYSKPWYARNISGQVRSVERLNLTVFDGSTAEMLRYCMRAWWEAWAHNKISGITKLMMRRSQQFSGTCRLLPGRSHSPRPATDCTGAAARVDRARFRALNLSIWRLYTVIAPLLFLATWKFPGTHCAAARL